MKCTLRFRTVLFCSAIFSGVFFAQIWHGKSNSKLAITQEKMCLPVICFLLEFLDCDPHLTVTGALLPRIKPLKNGQIKYKMTRL